MLPIHVPVTTNDIIQARNQATISVQGARGGTGGRGGVELVARCVDPTTGHVNTFRIALWVSDAVRRNFDVAANAYAAIEAQLLARSPGDVARFNQDLVDALRAEAQPTRARAANPVLTIRWDPAPVAEGVAASGLQALLVRHGLDTARA